VRAKLGITVGGRAASLPRTTAQLATSSSSPTRLSALLLLRPPPSPLPPGRRESANNNDTIARPLQKLVPHRATAPHNFW